MQTRQAARQFGHWLFVSQPIGVALQWCAVCSEWVSCALLCFGDARTRVGGLLYCNLSSSSCSCTVAQWHSGSEGKDHEQPKAASPKSGKGNYCEQQSSVSGQFSKWPHTHIASSFLSRIHSSCACICFSVLLLSVLVTNEDGGIVLPCCCCCAYK